MNTVGDSATEIPIVHKAIGVGLIFVGLLLYHSPEQAHHSPVTMSIAMSFLFIAGAALVTRAWLAIALACAFFSWLQVMGRAGNSTVLQYYFLVLAVVSSGYSLFVLSTRFRKRIAATRHARWQRRGNGSADG